MKGDDLIQMQIGEKNILTTDNLTIVITENRKLNSKFRRAKGIFLYDNIKIEKYQRNVLIERYEAHICR
jgi:hypothetical protein